jgi:hypothetical protein
MADKPSDLKPASEFGEVKVIKNEPDRAGKTPASAEGALDEPATIDKAREQSPGKTPGKAEG